MKTEIIEHRFAQSHYLNELPNFFKPIQRGARKGGIQLVYGSKKQGLILEVNMWRQVDIADQDLFLVILSLIAENKNGKALIPTQPKNEIDKHLIEKLELDDNFLLVPTLKMETTSYNLLNCLNKSDGEGNYKKLLESLKRLSGCFISYDTPKYCGTSNLMSFHHNKDTKKITISINPISAAVFVKNDNYILHNLNERLSFKSETTKAVHSYLNGLIRPGQNKTLELDTLVYAVYGDISDNQSTQKNRRAYIKKSIEEITKGKNKDFSLIQTMGTKYNFKRKKEFFENDILGGNYENNG